MPTDQFRRDDEMRLQQILDNTTTAAVFAKDLDGRYLFVNRAFEHYVNLPRKEILGRTTEEIFPRKSRSGSERTTGARSRPGLRSRPRRPPSSTAGRAPCSRTSFPWSVRTADPTRCAASQSTSAAASAPKRRCAA